MSTTYPIASSTPSTDGLMLSNSDVLFPSEKAVRTYFSTVRNTTRRIIRTNFSATTSGAGAGTGGALNAMSANLTGPNASTVGYAYSRPFGPSQTEEVTWLLR